MERYLDRIQITCTKKVWRDTDPIESVNEFSGVEPRSIETIDLKPYLIKMSELSYSFDEAQKENGQNQLYFLSSNMSFDLSGIVNNSYLPSFFNLFSDTDYTKWKIRLFIPPFNVLWEGIINQESIKTNYSPEETSEVISITALSLEKEMKEYFSKVPLPDQSEIFNSGYNTIGGIGHDNESRNIKRIGYVFGQLTPGAIWLPQGDLQDWCIIENPVLLNKSFEYGTSDNYVFVKSSYERIRANGENCYNLIRRICNSMGWVFYYQEGYFKIKDRGTEIQTTTTLDVNKIIEYEVTKYKEYDTFQHLMILDGTIDGGDNTGGNHGGESFRAYQLRGARFQLISDYNNPRLTNGLWWQSIGINSGLFYLNNINPYEKLIRYYNDDATNFNIAIHTKGQDDNPTWFWYTYGITKADILFIDAGDTGTEMWLYDVTNGANTPHSSDAQQPDPVNQWTSNRVRFKGCYGNALVKYQDLGTQSVITQTYQDYVKTDRFLNNWIKFFESKLTRSVTIKYDEIITNQIQVFNFKNDELNHFDGTWVINSMKINFQDETTTLELQKKFENNTRG